MSPQHSHERSFDLRSRNTSATAAVCAGVDGQEPSIIFANPWSTRPQFSEVGKGKATEGDILIPPRGLGRLGGIAVAAWLGSSGSQTGFKAQVSGG